MTYAQIAQRLYTQLVSLPEGVQITRNGKVKYYWYATITDASRLRLWNLMDKCKQLVSNPNIHIWRRRFTAATVPLKRDFLRQPTLPRDILCGIAFLSPSRTYRRAEV